MPILARLFLLPLLALGGLSAISAARDEALSRQMRMAIRDYEKGDDLNAMDRFMEILTSGAPGERAMANEYMNLITHRMSTGESLPGPRGMRSGGAVLEGPVRRPVRRPPEAEPEPSRSDAVEALVIDRPPEPPPPEPEPAKQPQVARRTPPPVSPILVEPIREPRRAREESQGSSAFVDDLQPPAGSISRGETRRQPFGFLGGKPEAPDKPARGPEEAKREIKDRLKNMSAAAVAELRRFEGVRMVLGKDGLPQGLSIASSRLFQSGAAFRRDASPVLNALGKLVFSLGRAQVEIFPEGAPFGEAKIIDMKRAAGVSSHLYSMGISPVRAKVNLVSGAGELPKALQNFRGIIVVFVQNQRMNLAKESLGDESGPPISLGVFPGSFQPNGQEGSIIEISVQDIPAGIASWSFQLLAPSSPDYSSELAPLQTERGEGPAFHQIYWNGRKGYFGPALPPGRYECVLSARDLKGRERRLHRWIQLLPSDDDLDSAGELSRAGERSTRIPAIGAPPGALEGERRSASSLVRSQPASTPRRQAASPPAVPAKPRIRPKAPAPMPQSRNAYDLAFKKDTFQLSEDADGTLSQIAERAGRDAAEGLNLIGFAQENEPEAGALAEQRAQMVAGLLINKYRVEPKRVRISSQVTAQSEYRVQVRFGGAAQ
ncbi:MAG: hypothetical protein HY549_11440 [Elusimicrobia bacterium]|nr:hypothetical protein [Elusimicrobiota bacterium]